VVTESLACVDKKETFLVTAAAAAVSSFVFPSLRNFSDVLTDLLVKHSVFTYASEKIKQHNQPPSVVNGN